MRLVEGLATVDDLDEFLTDLHTIGSKYEATIQAFDARYVLGREHLERAVQLAQRASERGERIARDESVEILLYAAGRRQIDRALEMGVSEGDARVVVVIAGGDETGAADAVGSMLTPESTLGSYDQELVCEFFDVTEREREATAATLQDIVCERVALLVVDQ